MLCYYKLYDGADCPNVQAPLPLMSLPLNPTPQQKTAWLDFVCRKTIGNKANNSKFTRLSEEDFPKAKGQIKLFQFLLLDDNFPTTNITPAKNTPHQTLPQSLQNSITIINSQPRKHTKINKGANLANCVRIKIKIDGLQEVPSEEFVPKYCIN